MIAGARPMPLSSSVMINKDEVLELLEEAIARLPDELRAARWLLKEREEFLAKVRREGDDILDQARARAERMVQRTEVVKAADQRARQIVERGRGRSPPAAPRVRGLLRPEAGQLRDRARAAAEDRGRRPGQAAGQSAHRRGTRVGRARRPASRRRPLAAGRSSTRTRSDVPARPARRRRRRPAAAPRLAARGRGVAGSLDGLAVSSARVPADGAGRRSTSCSSRMSDAVVGTGDGRGAPGGRVPPLPAAGHRRGSTASAGGVRAAPGRGRDLRLDGDTVDLEPMVRDAVLLALPLAPCAPTTALGPTRTATRSTDDGAVDPAGRAWDATSRSSLGRPRRAPFRAHGSEGNGLTGRRCDDGAR